MDYLIAAMLILFTTFNNILKMVTMYLNTDRLLHILEVINSHHLAPQDEVDEAILKKNSKVMTNLLKLCHICVCLCGTLWCIAPFRNRANGNDVVIPAYYPINRDSTLGFSFIVIYENLIMNLIGIGHMTIDVMIASFYIIMKAQLQIMRHHLQHIADGESNANSNELYEYRDSNPMFAKTLQRRLVYNVVKYEKISWLMKEVQSIFDNAIIVQFMVSAGILCVVVYKLVQKISLSFDFFYLLQYTNSLLVELFLYCYFGTQAEFESNYINESLYLSEWYNLSPKFRKQLIIVMSRWNFPLKPRAAYIIPVSLKTFVGVLRLSYSLYTLLKSTSN